MRLVNLKDKATYWKVIGSNGEGGHIFAKPVLINTRWEVRQQLFLSTDGRESVSNAVVMLDRCVAVEDYLALGDYSLWLDPQELLSTQEAWEIRQYQRVTNLRNSVANHTAFL